MAAADDPMHLHRIRTLLPSFRTAISSLTTTTTSPSLHIVKSFPPRPTSPSPPTSTSTSLQKQRTVCILDSSFNPPTKAHMHLALQALRKYTPPSKSSGSNSSGIINNGEEEDGKQEDEWPSLLLLLATTNADKPSSPAAYEHRLAMMCLLAEEIQNTYLPSSSSISKDTTATTGVPQIDIGITPHPRFIDKSSALSLHPFFTAGLTRQVWILGYDTLIRLLDPKYYPPHHTLRDLHTTLLSSQNRILVFTRPDAKYGTQASQYEYSKSLDDDGITQKIDIVESADEVNGVSSTNVRNDVKDGKDGWEMGVCGGVAEWIVREGLYL